ncbi:MAG: hypothetical protein H6500_01165 [Candidatus Woesearchaeota archaeon]|nr:hypothetical protein [Nanoarchaeota archaeon]USN44442.1 MAG: hypothetical protein H6500_01165 [Candidatus Woesearchaeota archaeon]
MKGKKAGIGDYMTAIVAVILATLIMGVTYFLLSKTSHGVEANVPEKIQEFPKVYLTHFLNTKLSSSDLNTLGLNTNEKDLRLRDVMHLPYKTLRPFLVEKRSEYLSEFGTSGSVEAEKKIHTYYNDFSGWVNSDDDLLFVSCAENDFASYAQVYNEVVNNYCFFFAQDNADGTYVFVCFMKPSSFKSADPVVGSVCAIGEQTESDLSTQGEADLS